MNNNRFFLRLSLSLNVVKLNDVRFFFSLISQQFLEVQGTHQFEFIGKKKIIATLFKASTIVFPNDIYDLLGSFSNDDGNGKKNVT